MFMKKFFILLILTVFAVNVNAQWFLGGNVGINATIAETPQKNIPYLDRNREYLVGLSFAPKMGYYFKEKLAFGVEFAIGVDFAKTWLQYHNPYSNTYEWYKYEGTFLNWRIAPFLRYSVFNHKKFTLMLEGSLGASGQHIIDYQFIIGVGILNVTPILSYSVTDKLQLEAVLGFINLGYNLDMLFEGTGSTIPSALKHDLNIGFNSKSVFVLSQLTIGIVYKFD